MESRAFDVSVSGSSRRAPADDVERMEGYLQRETNRDVGWANSRSRSSSSNPERPVLEAIPITHAFHRLEDSRVCDEPICSFPPEEIKQFREEWDIPSGIPMCGLYLGELA